MDGEEVTVAVVAEPLGTCSAAALCCAAVAALGFAISCAMLLVLFRRVQKMTCWELKYTVSDGPHATWSNGYTPTVVLPLAAVLRSRNHAPSICGDGDQSSLPK